MELNERSKSNEGPNSNEAMCNAKRRTQLKRGTMHGAQRTTQVKRRTQLKGMSSSAHTKFPAQTIIINDLSSSNEAASSAKVSGEINVSRGTNNNMHEFAGISLLCRRILTHLIIITLFTL